MPSPIGNLYLEVDGEGRLVQLLVNAEGTLKSAETKEVENQLEEYFAGERTTFDIPLAPRGTEFQKKVWEALRTIPYGEVRSYRWLAETVGSPKGFRAVGHANGQNPISIVTPCHRVIHENGNLGGYSGGLEAKAILLELERGLLV
jgi:methylated-DNA-[protein]-cysteine S-methyltransferase